jgi:shikimate dehydrogenase
VDPGSPVIRLAVFGKPIAHSLSPRIHGLFAQQLGLHVDYRAIEATHEDFERKVHELMAAGGRGCNVTVPLKHMAWKVAAESSDSAVRAQAANTLSFEADGRIVADNTDGEGLVDDLQSLPRGSGSFIALRGSRICLLGAGGAAAGILGAVLKAGPDCVVVANRTIARARELVARHVDMGKVTACQPENLARHTPFDLIINATSQGHGGAAPGIEPGWFAPDGFCYDLNYGPAALPLQKACASLAIPYADGLGMLVRQAALSFELWTGMLPDRNTVLHELRG